MRMKVKFNKPGYTFRGREVPSGLIGEVDINLTTNTELGKIIGIHGNDHKTYVVFLNSFRLWLQKDICTVVEGPSHRLKWIPPEGGKPGTFEKVLIEEKEIIVDTTKLLPEFTTETKREYSDTMIEFNVQEE